MIDLTNTTKRGKHRDSYQYIGFLGGHILLHDDGNMLVWDDKRAIRADLQAGK